MAINQECATCRFWVQSDESHFAGECRRNPPTIHDRLILYPSKKIGNIYDASVWPVTLDGHWCGDYRQKTI